MADERGKWLNDELFAAFVVDTEFAVRIAYQSTNRILLPWRATFVESEAIDSRILSLTGNDQTASGAVSDLLQQVSKATFFRSIKSGCGNDAHDFQPSFGAPGNADGTTGPVERIEGMWQCSRCRVSVKKA